MPVLQPRRMALCAAAFLCLGAPAVAQDVQSGIAAWQAGDYARAVTEWRPLAEAGNADAQFNLAQAYRLGRGAPQDLTLAEQWFERAARQRHEQAGSSLGLLLFQNGRAREAMPWIQAAALRGDPRAQYVFGTALFNGDILRRDLPRAYAMMTLAAAQGFPQAQAQLADMERQMAAADLDRGRRMAVEMGGHHGPQIAALPPTAVAPAAPAPRPTAPAAAPVQPRYTPPHQPEAGISYTAPPVNGQRVTTTQQAAPAAPVLRPSAPAPAPAPASDPAPTATPAAPAAPAARAPAPAARAAAESGWQVQLGAFSNAANARRQWETLRRRVSALGRLEPSYPAAGALTRLRVGVADRAAADRLCAAVRSAGAACLIVAP